MSAAVDWCSFYNLLLFYLQMTRKRHKPLYFTSWNYDKLYIVFVFNLESYLLRFNKHNQLIKCIIKHLDIEKESLRFAILVWKYGASHFLLSKETWRRDEPRSSPADEQTSRWIKFTGNEMNSVEIKLADLIRRHPNLYDQSRRDYKDTLKGHLSWKEVAGAMDKSEDEVKLKWKNLRDKFCKAKKRMAKRSGPLLDDEENRRERPAPLLYNQLVWLSEYVNPRVESASGDGEEVSVVSSRSYISALPFCHIRQQLLAFSSYCSYL